MDLQNTVKEALNALYHHPNDTVRMQADRYLQDFQRTLDEWQVLSSTLCCFEYCLKPSSTASINDVRSAVEGMLEKRSLSYNGGPILVPLDIPFLADNVQRICICDTGEGMQNDEVLLFWQVKPVVHVFQGVKSENSSTKMQDLKKQGDFRYYGSAATATSLSQKDLKTRGSEENNFKPKEVVLFQYKACPFCNKVKDYYDISYRVVEVNPMNKKEIKWSDYKKVPIVTVDGEQLVESSVVQIVLEMKSCSELYIDRTAYTAMVDDLLTCGSVKDLTLSSPSSTATTEVEDGGLTITVAMAKEAAMHYQSGNFDECLEVLHHLLEQKAIQREIRKKVDEQIRTLIENGVKLRHRSMFVIIGDKSRDQIVNLHYMLSKAQIKSSPTILWCYKDKLELSRFFIWCMYSNIFVTTPSPENLKTLFKFICKGLDVLDYKAKTIAQFARMTAEDSRKLLPPMFYPSFGGLH